MSVVDFVFSEAPLFVWQNAFFKLIIEQGNEYSHSHSHLHPDSKNLTDWRFMPSLVASFHDTTNNNQPKLCAINMQKNVQRILMRLNEANEGRATTTEKKQDTRQQQKTE